MILNSGILNELALLSSIGLPKEGMLLMLKFELQEFYLFNFSIPFPYDLTDNFLMDLPIELTLLSSFCESLSPKLLRI